MFSLNTIKNRLLSSFHTNRTNVYATLFITLIFTVFLVEITLSNLSISAFFSQYQDLILVSLLGVVCGLYWMRLLRGSSSSSTNSKSTHQSTHPFTQNSDIASQFNAKLTTPSQESILQTHYRGIIFNKGHHSVKTYLIPQDSDYSPTYLPRVEQRVHSETDRQIDLRVLKRTSSHDVSFKQPILQTNPLQHHQFSFLFSHNHLSLN